MEISVISVQLAIKELQKEIFYQVANVYAQTIFMTMVLTKLVVVVTVPVFSAKTGIQLMTV